MNYFLHTNNAEIEKVLGDVPVENSPLEIDGRKGIVVSSTDIKKIGNVLAEFLGIKNKIKNVEMSVLGHTRYEGIDEVLVTVSKPNKVVVKDGWNGTKSDLFKKVTEEILGKVLDVTINIYVPHGKKDMGRKRGFNIFFWSSQTDHNSRTCPTKMWGINVDCRDPVFEPTYDGIVIYDNTYPVAELIDNNLYIHHDLCHHGTTNELEIYRKILVEVVKEINISPEERAKQKEARAKENKKQYIQLCRKRIQKEHDNAASTIRSLESRLEDYKKGMIECIRGIADKKLLLANFEGELGKRDDEYAAEYDKLFEVEHVVGVEVSSRGVEVFTDNLYCKDPRSGKIHDIGCFRISIPIGCGSIIWNNLTRRVSGHSSSMHAPHIFSNGKACLGNAEQVLPELIANYQFSIIAMYAIQFVESVNVSDSAGSLITKWPVAS